MIQQNLIPHTGQVSMPKVRSRMSLNSNILQGVPCLNLHMNYKQYKISY